jgi:hypothetical protein
MTKKLDNYCLTKLFEFAKAKAETNFTDMFYQHVVIALEELISRRKADDHEPQADNVETIRAIEYVCAMSRQRTTDELTVFESSLLPKVWDYLVRDARKLAPALARLSAPIDVQAKAEAVVKYYCGTYALTDLQREKLSRLIVEQFSSKG